MKDIINIGLDLKKPALTITTDWTVLMGILVLISVYLILKRFNPLYRLLKWIAGTADIEIEIGAGVKIKAKIDRSRENIYIAHRILVELETLNLRKTL
jgi:hypothetical protein